MAHRLGRKPASQSEDRRGIIIVKLCRREVKYDLMKACKSVKPTYTLALLPLALFSLFAIDKLMRLWYSFHVNNYFCLQYFPYFHVLCAHQLYTLALLPLALFSLFARDKLMRLWYSFHVNNYFCLQYFPYFHVLCAHQLYTLALLPLALFSLFARDKLMRLWYSFHVNNYFCLQYFPYFHVLCAHQLYTLALLPVALFSLFARDKLMRLWYSLISYGTFYFCDYSAYNYRQFSYVSCLSYVYTRYVSFTLFSLVMRDQLMLLWYYCLTIVLLLCLSIRQFKVGLLIITCNVILFKLIFMQIITLLLLLAYCPHSNLMSYFLYLSELSNTSV